MVHSGPHMTVFAHYLPELGKVSKQEIHIWNTFLLLWCTILMASEYCDAVCRVVMKTSFLEVNSYVIGGATCAFWWTWWQRVQTHEDQNKPVCLFSTQFHFYLVICIHINILAISLVILHSFKRIKSSRLRKA